MCRSELWYLPQTRTFRMLTYRPWRLSPRVEEAPLSEYAGVRTAKMKDDYGVGTLNETQRQALLAYLKTL